MSSSALSAPLPRRGIVLADLVPGTVARDVALVVGGAILMGVTAQLAIPLPGTPVPLTLGTFAVLTLGAAYGWQRAALTMLLYVAVGAAGVPWFAQGTSGFGFPSSGYLVGYLVAAVAIGALARRGVDRSPLQTAGAMLLGNAVIYAFGVPYLAWSLGMDASAAIAAGLTPFLVGDAIKAAAAAGLLPLTWRLMDRLHRG
ncbi:biotin transporter BioY [Nocardioides marmoraquaticus]